MFTTVISCPSVALIFFSSLMVNLYFFSYTENVERKGSNEVNTFIYHCVIEILDKKVKHLEILCKSCGDQNKDFLVLEYRHYLVLLFSENNIYHQRSFIHQVWQEHVFDQYQKYCWDVWRLDQSHWRNAMQSKILLSWSSRSEHNQGLVLFPSSGIFEEMPIHDTTNKRSRNNNRISSFHFTPRNLQWSVGHICNY